MLGRSWMERCWAGNWRGSGSERFCSGTGVSLGLLERFCKGAGEALLGVGQVLDGRCWRGDCRCSLARGGGEVLERFRRGSGEVPERFRRGSGEVPERFRRGSGEVPERFRRGSGKVPERFRIGSGEVLEGFRRGCGEVLERFRRFWGGDVLQRCILIIMIIMNIMRFRRGVGQVLDGKVLGR